ncbi:O-antigen ligase [Caulobacter sp. X]|uniref:O-antigen ligase family protein n=1 Tax=Caulobacter sp. X TaxID=2048901 RepID=UPI0011787173|nr:O-antigen ligase family protein [Caulobacter sp. X]
MNAVFGSWQIKFLAALLFAVLASNAAYGNAARFIKYSAYYIGFFAVYVVAAGVDKSRGLRISVLIFLCYNVVFGFAQIAIGRPIFYQPPIDLKLLTETTARYFGQTSWSEAGRGIRPNGFYLYPTSYGFGLVLASSLLFLNSRILAGASGVVLGFLSLTRNSAVGAFAGLAFDLISRRIRRPQVRLLVFIFAALAIFVGYVAVFSTGDTGSAGEYIGKILGRGRSADESTLFRAKLYQDTIMDFYQNNATFPFFGFSDVRGATLLGQKTLPLGSHSTFLASLYRFGVVGLFGFVCLLISMGRTAVKAGRGGLVVALLMMMVTEDILIDPINLLIAGAALGLLSRDTKKVA